MKIVPLVGTDVEVGDNLFGVDLFEKFGFTIVQIASLEMDNAEEKCN